MKINNLFQILVPKDTKFFPMVKALAENNKKLTENVKTILTSGYSDQQYQAVVGLKSENEVLLKKVHVELASSFITPFDREDIYQLVTKLHSISKCLNGACSRIKIYNVTQFDGEMKQLLEIVISCNLLIEESINHLEKNTTLQDKIIKIGDLENKADSIYDHAIENLFKTQTNAIEVIKIKEILLAFEKATDKCNEVANILELISLKHS